MKRLIQARCVGREAVCLSPGREAGVGSPVGGRSEQTAAERGSGAGGVKATLGAAVTIHATAARRAEWSPVLCSASFVHAWDPGFTRVACKYISETALLYCHGTSSLECS